MKQWIYNSARLCVAIIFLLGTVTIAQEPKSTAAFARLTSLVGEWTGVESDTPVIVTYTLIAHGSTLMEDTRPTDGSSAMAMETMFSVDGNRLLATHYCDAKNQPQMATRAVTNPDAKSFAFSLVRVTGMKTPGDWHNTSLEITLDDKDHLTQKWTYLSKGKPGTTIFHLTRKST
jgi:hypothetical protein